MQQFQPVYMAASPYPMFMQSTPIYTGTPPAMPMFMLSPITPYGSKSLLEFNASSPDRQSNSTDEWTEEKIEIPSWIVGPLMGRDGIHLDHIRRYTGCRLYVLKAKNAANNARESEVKIRGRPVDVTNVEKIVQNMINICSQANEKFKHGGDRLSHLYQRAFIQEREVLRMILDTLVLGN